jgi:translation initiation factor IF-2
MSEDKSIKLIKAVKELNIGMGTIVDFLATKGYKVEKHPMAKLDNDMYTTLLKEFAVDKIIKEEAKQISIGKIRKEEPGQAPEKPVENRRSRDFENEEILIKNTGHFTSPPAEKPKPAEPVQAKTDERNEALPGVKVIGKIDLNNLNAKAPAKPPRHQKRPSRLLKEAPNLEASCRNAKSTRAG